MLVSAKAAAVTLDEWRTVESIAMEEVIGLCGKTFRFWQTDRSDELLIGESR